MEPRIKAKGGWYNYSTRKFNKNKLSDSDLRFDSKGEYQCWKTLTDKFGDNIVVQCKVRLAIGTRKGYKKNFWVCDFALFAKDNIGSEILGRIYKRYNGVVQSGITHRQKLYLEFKGNLTDDLRKTVATLRFNDYYKNQVIFCTSTNPFAVVTETEDTYSYTPVLTLSYLLK